MKYIDLQLHSVYSDGELLPRQLVECAKKENLAVIALTDHNTIDGVTKAQEAGTKEKIEVIPGVEIYTEFSGKRLHLLGYNFNLEDKNLNDLLWQSQVHHLEWAKKSLKKMAEMGFQIDFSDLEKIKSKYCGFRHLKTIVEKYKSNIQKMIADIRPQFSEPTLFEFINFYFADGKFAHIPEMNMSIDTILAIKTISDAGGLPVLAHPGQQLSWSDDHLISELKDAGLKGLEVLSPYHNWHQTEHYQKIANDLDLVISGGSDFHGDLVDFSLKHQFVKSAWDYFRVPYAIYENLKKHLK
ncbi:MAG: PHP domain-containing protein [Patescibacteria group bacterium]